MVSNNKKVQTIKNMIIRGMFQHSEIQPRLDAIGASEIKADTIANLAIKYRYGINKGLIDKIIDFIWGIIGKIITITVIIVSALLNAEFKAAKIFSNSVVSGKLNGVGENLLFWMGKKSVPLTGPEMINSFADIVKATPQILFSMLIGGIAGYLIWKLFLILIKFIYKRQRLEFNIRKLVKMHS